MTDINYPPNGSWTGHSHSPFEDSVREIMTEMGASFAGLWRKPMALEYATAYLDGRLVFYTHKEGLDALYLRDDEWFISVRSTSMTIRRRSIL